MTRFFRKIHGSSCESEDHSAKRGTIILAEETLYGPSVEEIKMRRHVQGESSQGMPCRGEEYRKTY